MKEASVAVQNILSIVKDKGCNAIDWEISKSAMIHQVLSSMISQAAAKKRNVKETSPMEEALAYLETHFTEEIRLDQITQFLLMGKSSFCHRFKQEIGMPPYEYLLAKRVNQAKYLLQTTDLTVGEIAYAVGFQRDTNFVKHFKKRNGMTPEEFRRIVV